jgi:hypothetical protein
MSRGLRYGTPKDAQSDLLFSYVGHDPHCNHEAASSEGSRDLYYLVPLECPHLRDIPPLCEHNLFLLLRV